MKKKKTKMGYFKVRSFASGTWSLAFKAIYSMAGLFLTIHSFFFGDFQPILDFRSYTNV